MGPKRHDPDDGEPRPKKGRSWARSAYMSPEQARGQEGGRAVGHLQLRLGAVRDGDRPAGLSTGTRRSRRWRPSCRKNPTPPSQMVEGLPKELEPDFPRCLRKDPERRFQTMADLKVALEELKEESDSGTLETEETAKPEPRRRLMWGAALAGVLLITITGVWFLRSRTPTLDQPSKPPEMPVRKFAFTPPGDPWAPVIAPNGKHIAYIAGEAPQRRLWIQDLESIEPRAIKNSEGAQEPFWSPDSEYVSFAAGGELRRAHAQSGDSAAICHLPPQLFLGGAWSPDGERRSFMRSFGKESTKFRPAGAPPSSSLKWTLVWERETTSRTPHSNLCQTGIPSLYMNRRGSVKSTKLSYTP